MEVSVLLFVAAYLLGSIPSAVWIGKRFYGIDVREHGSHNAGATNTLRVLGRRAAFAVFAIDFAKGFAAVILSHLSGYENGSDALFNLKIALVAGAVLGHIFPIFAHFRGGKGVATLAGAVLGVYPPGVLVCLVIFITVWAIWNYVSLASVTAGTAFPFVVYFIFGERSASLIVFSCVIALLLIFTHRKNIRRLIARTESRTYLWRKKKEE